MVLKKRENNAKVFTDAKIKLTLYLAIETYQGDIKTS